MRLLLILAFFFWPLSASAAERIQVPPEAQAKLTAKDFRGAAVIIQPVLEQCLSLADPGDKCLDVMLFLVRVADVSGDTANYDRFLALALQYGELVLPPLDRQLADLRSDTADRLFSAKDYAAALPLYEKVLAARRAATPVDDAALVQTLSDLEITLSVQGKFADAMPFASERAVIARRIADPFKLADALWREGRVLLEVGRADDAVARLREADALNAKGGPDRRVARMTALDQLSVTLFEQRKLTEARAVAVQALALATGLEGPNGSSTLDLMGDIAIYDRDLGNLDSAETGLRLAIARSEATPPASAKIRVRLYSALSTILQRRGRALESVQIMAKPIEDMATLSTSEQNELSDVLQNYAVGLSEIGRLAEAETMSRRVLAMRKATLGADDPLIARAFSALGYILEKLGRREEALAAHIEATTLRLGKGKDEATLARDDLLITSVGNVAVTLMQLGRLEQAKPFQEMALSLSRARFPVGSDDLATALNRWAQYRKAMGVCDGLDASREARAIWAGMAGTVSQDRVIGDINLASYLHMCRGSVAEQRSYWLDAMRYLLADAGQSTDYDDRAKALLRERRIAFYGLVRANWDLATAK